MASRMLSKLINRIVADFIDIDELMKRYQQRNEKKIKNKCTSGPGSKFYPESNVVNLQGNKKAIIIGSHCHIRGHLQVFAQGGQINIGDFCYVGETSKIWSAAQISVGNRVLISHNVNIHDNISHPIDARLRHMDFLRIIGLEKISANEFDLRSKPIVIEDDVWVGFNCTIRKNVTIGKGSIVGSGSFVTESIPPNVVVAGAPAKIIKEIK